jgi:hypothetical protein
LEVVGACNLMAGTDGRDVTGDVAGRLRGLGKPYVRILA